jgi:formate dehydrogenase iron-sulfur subunit
MSTTIADSTKPIDLVSQLLAAQLQLTAVEAFANWHGAAHSNPTVYQSLLPTSSPQTGQQYAFEVDLDACSGCKACVVACHSLNGLEEHETWRKVGLLNSTAGDLPVIQHVTTACHHCIDPGCLNGCPVLAYEKDPITGVVRHLDDQCFGCKYCLMMCPYEVPQYSPSLGIVRKCDMCMGRIEQNEAPACVQACPSQAIKISIIDVASVQAENSKTAYEQRLIATAPPSRLTQPTTRFTSTRSLSLLQGSDVVSRESVSDEPQPTHAPLVVMLVLTQASVGLWIAITAAIVSEFWQTKAIFAASITASLIGFIGVQAALLHLGRPWLAFRSILGWRRSWLSREAIAFGLYLAASFLATSSSILNQLEWLRPFASVAAVLLGCAAVFCSAMIYVATGRELWSLMRTLTEFTGTTLGLGMAMASLFTPNEPAASMLLMATLLCGLAYLPKLADWIASSKAANHWDDFSGRSGRLVRTHFGKLLSGGVLCLALAAGLGFSMRLIQSELIDSVIAMAASVLLVLSQLIVRCLYFASVVFARMPGAKS